MRGYSQGMGVSERQVSPKVRNPDTFQAAPRSSETGKERLRFWVMRPLEAVWLHQRPRLLPPSMKPAASRCRWVPGQVLGGRSSAQFGG